MSARKGKEDRNMSMTEIIDDMTQEMVGGDGFECFMNKPLLHNGQAYIQGDYKTGKDYICCPYCGKKNFLLTPGAHITGQKFKCKGSGCKKIFEVNIENGREIK